MGSINLSGNQYLNSAGTWVSYGCGSNNAYFPKEFRATVTNNVGGGMWISLRCAPTGYQGTGSGSVWFNNGESKVLQTWAPCTAPDSTVHRLDAAGVYGGMSYWSNPCDVVVRRYESGRLGILAAEYSMDGIAYLPLQSGQSFNPLTPPRYLRFLCTDKDHCPSSWGDGYIDILGPQNQVLFQGMGLLQSGNANWFDLVTSDLLAWPVKDAVAAGPAGYGITARLRSDYISSTATFPFNLNILSAPDPNYEPSLPGVPGLPGLPRPPDVPGLPSVDQLLALAASAAQIAKVLALQCNVNIVANDYAMQSQFKHVGIGGLGTGAVSTPFFINEAPQENACFVFYDQAYDLTVHNAPANANIPAVGKLHTVCANLGTLVTDATGKSAPLRVNFRDVTRNLNVADYYLASAVGGGVFQLILSHGVTGAVHTYLASPGGTLTTLPRVNTQTPCIEPRQSPL